MEFIKKDLIYLLGFCMIFYYFNSKTEKMSNTDIKKIIQEEYKIDVDAIRNLSKLANDLTANNRLIVLRGISKFINEIDQEDQSIEFFKNKMLYWTNKRQQFVAEGPSANWVLASTLEAICQMFILEETDLVKKFLSSPPIQQFGK